MSNQTSTKLYQILTESYPHSYKHFLSTDFTKLVNRPIRKLIQFFDEAQINTKLKTKHTGIIIEIADLEHQRISIEERRQTLRKLEKQALKTERMLSMYASVTNIIPNLDDQYKILGYIVDKDKNMVEKFEVDLSKSTSFDTCSIWKLIH